MLKEYIKDFCSISKNKVSLETKSAFQKIITLVCVNVAKTRLKATKESALNFEEDFFFFNIKRNNYFLHYHIQLDLKKKK